MIGPLGGSEVLLVFVLALLLFGPRRLPELGRTFGKTIAQLRRAATDFKMDLEREIKVEEIQDAQRGLGALREDVREALNGVEGTAARPPQRETPPPDGRRAPLDDRSEDSTPDDGADGSKEPSGASSG